MDVLFVHTEDIVLDWKSIRRDLERENHHVEHAATYSEAIQKIARCRHATAVVNCICVSNDIPFEHALQVMRSIAPDCRLIVIKNTESINNAKLLREIGLFYCTTATTDKAEITEAIGCALRAASRNNESVE